MLTDIDLNDAPLTPADESASAAEAQHPRPTTSHPQLQQQQLHPAGPEASAAAPSRRPAVLRGRPSYHFSVKRPRRNIVKRSIAALPTTQLQNISEEKETLLGFAIGSQRNDGNHDPHRAPRAALALFLLVCSIGGYRGVNEYWTARVNAASSTVMTNKQDEDVTLSFRGSVASDGEHREAMLLDDTNGSLEEGTAAIMSEENIEALFDGTVIVPEHASNLANVFEEPYHPMQNKLLLWHIPRSGSRSFARIASYCLGLTVASEAGKSEVKAGNNQVLRIVEGLDGMHFANVDTSNPEGIALAKTLNVGQSDQVDLVSSPYLWDLAGIFDEGHKGYMLAMFRHPIERAASLYYSMRKDKLYEKQVGSLTSIEQYAKSSLVENNWMTRFLSNTLSGELTPEHEAIAREVLRTKCIVGLLREKTETMRRLEVLFKHRTRERSQRTDECQEKLLYWDWPGKNRHDPVVRGSEAWETLSRHNSFDLRLYEFAEKLFEEQKSLFDEDGKLSAGENLGYDSQTL